MCKLRDILRLRYEAELSIRHVAASLRLSPTTVAGYLRRLEATGLAWPLPEEFTDRVIERRLFPSVSLTKTRPVPDWATVQVELRRHKGVTLGLLWQEYIEEHPDGYSYSRFCEIYVASQLSPMRDAEAL